MKKPNEFIEVFMSLIKWFLIILLLNNAIWATVFIVATNDAGAIAEQSPNANV